MLSELIYISEIKNIGDQSEQHSLSGIIKKFFV